METLSDKEIIEKIQEGEIDYFSHLVKKYLPAVRSFAAPKIFEKQDVDDIVQNAFVSFYKAIHRFDRKRPVLPYLFEIVKNEMKMYFRSKKQTVALDETIETPGVAEETEAPSQELLQKLSEQERRALQLLYEGFSYKEIADQLKKPLNTVRTIIRRARLELLKSRR